MAGIYIHTPFCTQMCYYCDFFSSASITQKREILSAIIDELEIRQDYLEDRSIDTIYIGGGTPSVFCVDELQSIINKVQSLWDTTSVKEITMEANPDDLTQEYLLKLKDSSINRLSIGIQSFEDKLLKFMNRRHNAIEAINVVKNAQRIGFDNITIDLMYGIHGLSNQMWIDTIKQALDLGVQHISAYHLTIEPKTVFGIREKRGELTPVDESVGAEQYDILHNMLESAGFEHYEVSNFAKSGFRAKHNSSYWRGDKYLGVGPSAHSFNGESRDWNISSLNGYLKGYKDGSSLEQEVLTDRDIQNEYIMTRFRTKEGISLKDFETKFGHDNFNIIKIVADKEIANGRLIENNGFYKIPPVKFLVSDAVICNFFV